MLLGPHGPAEAKGLRVGPNAVPFIGTLLDFWMVVASKLESHSFPKFLTSCYVMDGMTAPEIVNCNLLPTFHFFTTMDLDLVLTHPCPRDVLSVLVGSTYFLGLML